MKKRVRIISDVVLILCAIVFVFAGWKLWGYYSQYKGVEEEYSDLRKYVHEKQEEEIDEDKNRIGEGVDVCPIKVDFDKLKKINNETVGWIYIPDSPINYPILQPTKDREDYYLKRTFERAKNFGGAIFVDPLCEPDFSSDNSIIYGHNLKNGEMFGSLKTMYDINYNKDAKYSEHPIIWILTPTEIKEYKVFCGKEISATKNKSVYTIEFATTSEFEKYLKQEKKSSLFRTKVDVSTAEPIITLSTCTSTSQEGRFILQAILVQDIPQKQK